MTEAENDSLTKPFTKKETKEDIFSCYEEGGPGPNGIFFLFYCKFWDVVKLTS